MRLTVPLVALGGQKCPPFRLLTRSHSKGSWKGCMATASEPVVVFERELQLLVLHRHADRDPNEPFPRCSSRLFDIADLRPLKNEHYGVPSNLNN